MEIPYILKRSKRKTICLTFDAKQSVLVRAPLRMPNRAIKEFVNKHKDWIHLHQERLLQSAQIKEAFTYSDGDTAFIMGRPITICTGARVELLANDKLALPTKDRARELEGYLRELAAKHMAERVEYFARIMQVEPTGIRITGAQKRWGSCNATNSLCFSWRCMALPCELIDYIVVHELAHIQQHNHSPQFYAIVNTVLPTYKELEQKLSDFQLLLPY